jgi:hypothetical protein
MAKLQEKTKPYLIPMLEGKHIVLQTNGQRTLAGWIAVMVAVSENLDNESVAIPFRDRQFIRANKRPPSRWRIWIGQHRRSNFELFIHNAMPLGTEQEAQGLAPDAPANPNTQTTTICLGNHLVIHVIGSDRVWPFIRRWQLPRAVRDIMVEIWPVRGVERWPTAMTALDDDGLELLSMHFFNEMRLIA